ncbi:MAG: helix-turn-helix domain-containing protein [Clostridiales bacterium]|nr:helix-turn-helix domain-containing protein [Clostridiales bacterium]
MSYIDIIVKRINELCSKYNYSYDKLAKMSGLSHTIINKIVCGSIKAPKLITLHKIALTFGMTLSEFFNYPELNDFSFDDNEE